MSLFVTYTGMSDVRAPKIIEAQLQGKNQIEIAEDLGVSKRTIIRDIQTPIYNTLIQGFFQTYQDKLTELLESEQVTVQLEIIKELGRMYRAGMTKHTQITEDLTLTHNINITENRKKKDELFKSLELTPDQWAVIEDSVKTEKEET